MAEAIGSTGVKKEITFLGKVTDSLQAVLNKVAARVVSKRLFAGTPRTGEVSTTRPTKEQTEAALNMHEAFLNFDGALIRREQVSIQYIEPFTAWVRIISDETLKEALSGTRDTEFSTLGSFLYSAMDQIFEIKAGSDLHERGFEAIVNLSETLSIRLGGENRGTTFSVRPDLLGSLYKEIKAGLDNIGNNIAYVNIFASWAATLPDPLLARILSGTTEGNNIFQITDVLDTCLFRIARLDSEEDNSDAPKKEIYEQASFAVGRFFQILEERALSSDYEYLNIATINRRKFAVKDWFDFNPFKRREESSLRVSLRQSLLWDWAKRNAGVKEPSSVDDAIWGVVDEFMQRTINGISSAQYKVVPEQRDTYKNFVIYSPFSQIRRTPYEINMEIFSSIHPLGIEIVLHEIESMQKTEQSIDGIENISVPQLRIALAQYVLSKFESVESFQAGS